MNNAVGSCLNLGTKSTTAIIGINSPSTAAQMCASEFLHVALNSFSLFRMGIAINVGYTRLESRSERSISAQ